ncbi:Asp-tRNA(Asn)/Glu-tRNA(Gln) amidotransferase subunit GatC [Candidatus Pandoraea novymonadis]|nr:Asp-tRNA(Asn)/Glu-tRNA(Gln) amidotransferase subunit GatC [Candidatus Pandoraea novymonadis]
MTLNLSDIKRIAHLACLELSDDEASHMGGELNKFLTLLKQIQAVDTTNVAPLAHPIEQIQTITQRLREDIVTETVVCQDNQQLAPATQDGLYLVPKVIE